MSTAIQVQNLSKKYILKHQDSAHYNTLRDSLHAAAKRFAQRIRHPFGGGNYPSREEFWALKDIEFEIRQGERVGVIGRNGAGKSTLLKLLSRITDPTTGRIAITGRVASLLEVGTGFHPELTGRENIALNGAILGMRRAEINRRFDAIVAFAEVERFLDTPVKRYSSGMYVRLAFAVAAHLEPEILIVDEVLAVGDAQFQRKCLGKMKELGSEGRTVLFVSHNTSSILQLTDTCILLDQGRLAMRDSSAQCVTRYLQGGAAADTTQGIRNQRTDFAVLRFVLDREASPLGFNRPLVFNMELESARPLDGISVILGIENSLGARILTARARIDAIATRPKRFDLRLEGHSLAPGSYFASLTIWSAAQIIFEQTQILGLELVSNQEDEQHYGPYIAKVSDKLGCFRPLEVTHG